jgi:hypothetical protein
MGSGLAIIKKLLGWVGAIAETQQFSANAGFINPAYGITGVRVTLNA